jgi:hypothetical protein
MGHHREDLSFFQGVQKTRAQKEISITRKHSDDPCGEKFPTKGAPKEYLPYLYFFSLEIVPNQFFQVTIGQGLTIPKLGCQWRDQKEKGKEKGHQIRSLHLEGILKGWKEIQDLEKQIDQKPWEDKGKKQTQMGPKISGKR